MRLFKQKSADKVCLSTPKLVPQMRVCDCKEGDISKIFSGVVNIETKTGFNDSTPLFSCNGSKDGYFVDFVHFSNKKSADKACQSTLKMVSQTLPAILKEGEISKKFLEVVIHKVLSKGYLECQVGLAIAEDAHLGGIAYV